MANVTESASWESGIYRLETTDPILGGENGTSNIQAKQLANRTLYLKARADQIDEASAGFASLGARLNALNEQAQALGVDMADMSGATLKFAIDMANQANMQANALQTHLQQQGEATLYNRGVIRGCEVTRNTVAARNLNIAGGAAFMGGQVWMVPAKDGAASVPINDSNMPIYLKVYLKPDTGNSCMVLGVTSAAGNLPDNAVHIYNLTVPAGDTANDLSAVTITSVRRIESEYPRIMNSEPTLYIPLAKNLKDGDYQLNFELIESLGKQADHADIKIYSKAGNGFSLRSTSSADGIKIKWKLSYLTHNIGG